MLALMKMGILSDTHGDTCAAETAALLMREQGVCAVFHCGDIGGMDVLAELAAVFFPISVPVHAVLGNTDIHLSDWKFFPDDIGVEMHGRFGDIQVDGCRIALIHGDERARYLHTVSTGKYDLVLSGHTHAVHDFLEGATRCINPGSAGRGMPNSCAVLDFATAILTILPL